MSIQDIANNASNQYLMLYGELHIIITQYIALKENTIISLAER